MVSVGCGGSSTADRVISSLAAVLATFWATFGAEAVAVILRSSVVWSDVAANVFCTAAGSWSSFSFATIAEATR